MCFKPCHLTEMLMFLHWKEPGKALFHVFLVFDLDLILIQVLEIWKQVQRLGLRQRTNLGQKLSWVPLSLSLCFKPKLGPYWRLRNNLQIVNWGAFINVSFHRGTGSKVVSMHNLTRRWRRKETAHHPSWILKVLNAKESRGILQYLRPH